jgi:uncharacterized phage protein gp47/JayE
MAKLYAGETAENILNRILARVAARFDKRLGSVIYDATAPASIEFEALYTALDYILDQSFADTAERPYLIRRAAERGLKPFPATFAKVTGEFTPADLEIPLGSRFNCGEYIYSVVEQIEPGRYYLTCETAGAAANGQTGRLIPVQTINGLKTAELVEVSILGEDEEETERFRQRYFDSLTADQYGGNVADYKAKIRSLPGVGGVKVYPAWNGGGTVRCVIIDSALGVPTTTLVDEVQETIDPILVNGDNSQGLGLGVAPIGHYCTIMGANPATIDVRTRLTFRSGHSFQTTLPEIEAALEAYYRELNGDWQNRDNVIVRIAEINARLLAIPGVVDITDTTLNGQEQNVMVDADSIPVRGGFEIV